MRTWQIIFCIAVLLHNSATARQRPIPPSRNNNTAAAKSLVNEASAQQLDTLMKALHKVEVAKDSAGQIAALDKLAIYYIRAGQVEKSEPLLKQILDIQVKLGIKEQQKTYDNLVTVYRAKGDLSQALYYALESVRLAETLDDSARLNRYYGRLGGVYKDLGQFDKSLQYHQRSLARVQQHPQKDTFQLYTVTSSVVSALIRVDRAAEASRLIEETVAGYPPVQPDVKQLAATMRGETFQSQKDYKQAEQYFLEAVHWEEYSPHGFVLRFNTYYNIGAFYCDRGQYEKARPYLLQASATPGFGSHATQRNVQWLLFRADSAAGNYRSALQHFQAYKDISDTMFNAARSRQIEEMQAKYETDKKERDIQFLLHETRCQQTQLQQAATGRNVTISIIALLLVIIALLYGRYRSRQRNSRRLETQQHEIQRKNGSLEKLVKEKDGLLQEKEWLLKEIHHRVNNNLQIVISLLNTQLAYLDDESAAIAIRDSQQRMRAMSLIHQRLYHSDKLATVDIQNYIRELISYLDDNFNVNHRIRFLLELPVLELNVSQAVPVGLILNEAITNAIKYAFPGNQSGTITVTVREIENDHILLLISDNGAGLPVGFDMSASRTLGINLMQGLARQLNGTFTMKGQQGTVVAVSFPLEDVAALYEEKIAVVAL